METTVLHTPAIRRAASAVAIAAATALALPTAALADKPAPTQQDIPIGIALQALAPAIIGAAATPGAKADNPNAELLSQVRTLLTQADLPDQIRTTLLRVITFLDGSGGGGPEIPNNPGDPVIQQFLYPTLGTGCISETADSVGTALAVSGPATLPPPGPALGQTGFVFTALGTAPAAANQVEPLNVSWVNLNTGATGTQALTNDAKINPDGPTTLSTIANTGSGRIIATISGGITTESRSCTFLPTIGIIYTP
ncbi:MAG: Rv1157c family protein [Mycobacteriaceae bacterium]